MIQLTWKSETGFVYDLNDFRLLRQFSYSGEGWGLATNGGEVFMSDGTSEIRVLDAQTLQEKRRFRVHDGLTAVDQLNELDHLVFNESNSLTEEQLSPQVGVLNNLLPSQGELSGAMTAR